MPIRYHEDSNSPPKLKKILDQFSRHGAIAGTRGYILVGDIDAVIGGFAEYASAGPRTEARQFLIKKEVFLKERKHYYFDALRAQKLIECCAEKRRLEPAQNSADRLEELKQAARVRRMQRQEIAKANSMPAPVIPVSEPELVEEEPPAQNEVVLPPVQPTQPAAIPSASSVIPKFALFLTEPLQDLWITICDRAKAINPHEESSEWRFSVPEQTDAFFRAYASEKIQAQCTAAEYVRGLQRFIDHKIIERVAGDVRPGFRGFRFLVDPHLFFDVTIERLMDAYVTPEFAQMIIELQWQTSLLDDVSPGFKRRVVDFAMSRLSEANRASVEMRLFGRPATVHGSIGVVYFHKGSGRYMLCWPGFLEVNLVIKEKKLMTVSAESPQETLVAVLEPTQIETDTGMLVRHTHTGMLVRHTHTVVLRRSAATAFLKIAEGEFSGRLADYVHTSFTSKFQSNKWLLLERCGPHSTWTFGETVSCVRFELGGYYVGKILEQKEPGLIPADQWLQDLRAIVAGVVTNASAPVSSPKQAEEPVEEVIVPSVVTVPSEPEPVSEPEVAIEPASPSPHTGSLEELGSALASAKAQLEQAQEVYEQAVAQLDCAKSLCDVAQMAYDNAVMSQRTQLECERAALAQRLAEIDSQLKNL